MSKLYQEHLRRLIHPSVGDDEVLRARHGSLISSHIAGGILSAVVFAVYFAITGAPGAAAGIACLCFVSQIGIGLFLSRTGDLITAHLLSAANLTALVMLAAVLSGGTTSFAIVWLVIVPLEAALCADRRTMVMATLLAAAALVGLHFATAAGMLPDPITLPVNTGTLAAFTGLGAVAYAGALAAGVQSIHRQSAISVERSRELYRLIAENANDLITRHDAAGRVLFASLASRSLLGIGPEHVIAGGFTRVLHPGDAERQARAIRRALSEGAPVSEEFRILRPSADGTAVNERWVEMRCQPVAAGGGEGPTVIAVTRDITTRKAEALAIAQARDEAERTSRAKTAFLATMSHELRTPLNAIIGFAELLHRELLIKAREPKHADYCRTIHQSGEHLLGLVKDLLDVSKIESGKLSVVPEPFALEDVVPGAVETLRPLAEGKGIRLVTEIPDDLADALADRRAVRQIVINLVSNACKFTGAGGRVTVTAERLGSGIELAVADTGIGIALEHVARLGQPFYQVDLRYARENDGAGLGLSIVRGLAELHGSALRIESAPGKGSRFSVVLPIDADACEHAAAAPAQTVIELPRAELRASERKVA